MPSFQNFTAVENYLNSLINYEHDFPLGGKRNQPKLQPTLDAIERMDLHRVLSNTIHIVGTKGKGSTVAYLEALFSPVASVLSFTSPHLVSVKERIRRNGCELEDPLWQKGFEEITTLLNRVPIIQLTYFETCFLFYLWASRELGTQLHVVEAGLGGKYDATNVLENTMTILTTVDYDHTDVLGDTLTKIAMDKGGAVKLGSSVVVGRQPKEALDVYREINREMKVKAFYFDDDYYYIDDSNGFRYESPLRNIRSLQLSMAGEHQKDNAVTALTAALLLPFKMSDNDIRTRLAACDIPGRQQFLPGDPKILLDVAHNPVSFRALSETLKQHCSNQKIPAVIGMVKGKDAPSCLREIRDYVDMVYIVELNNPRTLSGDELLKVAQSFGIHAEFVPSLDQAFRQLHEKAVGRFGLVAGSFYLAGDYLLWRRRAGIA